MKEIRETKLVEQTTVKFVADDGKEFAFESDCKAYEASKNKDTVESEFRKIHLITLFPPLVNWYYGDCAGCDIVRLEDKRDFDIMANYYYLKNKDIRDIAENRDLLKYPVTQIVTYGEEWVLFAPQSIEELKSAYINASNTLDLYIPKEQ